eukprot:778871_1
MSLGQKLKSIRQNITCNENEAPTNPTDGEGKSELEGNQIDDTKTELELTDRLKDLKEIARVEGYDENSYVMSTINDICKKIHSDPSTASKKINSIITEVMPFDYDEFFELFSATEK